MQSKHITAAQAGLHAWLKRRNERGLQRLRQAEIATAVLALVPAVGVALHVIPADAGWMTVAAIAFLFGLRAQSHRKAQQMHAAADMIEHAVLRSAVVAIAGPDGGVLFANQRLLKIRGCVDGLDAPNSLTSLFGVPHEQWPLNRPGVRRCAISTVVGTSSALTVLSLPLIAEDGALAAVLCVALPDEEQVADRPRSTLATTQITRPGPVAADHPAAIHLAPPQAAVWWKIDDLSRETRALDHAEIMGFLARYRARMVSPALLQICITELLELVVEELEAVAATRGLALKSVVAGSMPERLYIDPVCIGRVLTHLAEDALMHTDLGGVTIVAGWTPDADKASGVLSLHIVDTSRRTAPDGTGPATFENVLRDRLVAQYCETLLRLVSGHFAFESSSDSGSWASLSIPARAASARLMMQPTVPTVAICCADSAHSKLIRKHLQALGFDAIRDVTEGEVFSSPPAILVVDAMNGEDEREVRLKRLIAEHRSSVIQLYSGEKAVHRESDGTVCVPVPVRRRDLSIALHMLGWR